MNIYNNFETTPFLKRSVITVGTFDGVHKAHRIILDNVVQIAKSMQGNAVVISFSTHPRKVIHPELPLPVLTTVEEKNKLFQEIGIDTVIYIDFTQAVAEMSYVDFIRFLNQKIDVKTITVGYDHYFGKNKEGNISNLKKLVPLFGFDIVEIPQQTFNGIEISSSSIRDAINHKNFELANQLLGYRYKLETSIISQTKKYITIESTNKDKIIPPNGVYSVSIDGNHARIEIQNRKIFLYPENENIVSVNNNNQKIIVDFFN